MLEFVDLPIFENSPYLAFYSEVIIPDKNHAAPWSDFRFRRNTLRVTIVHRIVSGLFVQMIRNTHSNCFVALGVLVLVLLVVSVVQATEPAAVAPQIVEVFTSSDLPITGKVAINPGSVRSKTELQIYELDGIQRIEVELSRDLTADPEQSKRIVLQRIQQLDEASRSRMQHTAMGLANAVQYGVDRYPAMVFDGEVAIFGVTDIREALHRYQRWREGGK